MVLITETSKLATPNKIEDSFSWPSNNDVLEADRNPVSDEMTITGMSTKVRRWLYTSSDRL